MVGAGEADLARADARGQHDVVEAARGQAGGIHPLAQAQVHAGQRQLAAEVAQGFVELFLARDLLGQVELAADFGRRIKQRHLVATARGHAGAGQAGRAGTDHGHAPGRGGGRVVELGFGAGARIDQAAGLLADEDVVQAGLVAGDAGVDLVAAAFAGLAGPGRVGQQRPRHGHHVGLAAGEDGLGFVGHVDAVGGDQRQPDVGLQFGGDAGEGRARHRGGDGRHPRFMPADAGIDDGGAGRLDGPGLHHDLVPARAVLHQLEHRQPIDKDEVLAYRFADAAHDLDREAHALLRAAAPGILAPVGAGAEELVDQIAFRAHHFDPVVAGLAGQLRGGDEGLDLAFDAPGGKRARGQRADRRLHLGSRHQQGMRGIPAGVQDLQADAATGFVYRPGDDAVLVDFPGPAELAGEGLEPADQVGRDAAGDHQPDAAFGAFAEIGRQLGEIARVVLQPGVHRTHQDAVGQGAKAQVEGLEEAGVGLAGHVGRRRMTPGTLPGTAGPDKTPAYGTAAPGPDIRSSFWHHSYCSPTHARTARP